MRCVEQRILEATPRHQLSVTVKHKKNFIRVYKKTCSLAKSNAPHCNMRYFPQAINLFPKQSQVVEPCVPMACVITVAFQVGAAVPAARLGALSLLSHAGGTVIGGGDGTVTLFDNFYKDYAQTELRGGMVTLSFSADRTEVRKRLDLNLGYTCVCVLRFWGARRMGCLLI